MPPYLIGFNPEIRGFLKMPMMNPGADKTIRMKMRV
jgi:hypothetical protein